MEQAPGVTGLSAHTHKREREKRDKKKTGAYRYLSASFA